MFVNNENDENKVMFSKGVRYNLIKPNQYELDTGIYCWIKSNLYREAVPFSEKRFKRYFKTLDETRDIMINELLK